MAGIFRNIRQQAPERRRDERERGIQRNEGGGAAADRSNLTQLSSFKSPPSLFFLCALRVSVRGLLSAPSTALSVLGLKTGFVGGD